MLTNGSTADWISLYFHIPFCTHKCPYCHFYVVIDKPHFKDLLLQGFEREWQRIRPLLEHKKLASIYFGGGTPTLFEIQRIECLVEWIRKRFGSLEGVEITIEANPEQVTYSQMQAFKELGINRVSLGIQSFQSEELNLLGRKHSSKGSLDAIFATYDAGIHNISIDLMYELPRQTQTLWQQTLKQVATLPITHLSLYNLTIEPHTAFARQEQTLRPLLPDPELACAMYLDAISQLAAIGLQQYEISAFCKPGYHSRHNVGYWTGRFFLGLGPSAFSYYGTKRFRNIASLTRYCSLLQEGMSPVDFEEELDINKRRKELLALQLRLHEGVNLAVFESRFGPLEEETRHAISSLERQNLLKTMGDYLRLSAQGILFYDSVASELI